VRTTLPNGNRACRFASAGSVRGRPLAEDRVEMDRVQLVRAFDNTIVFLISVVKNNRRGLETALANTVL
jgi:hypothetical protein